MQGSKETKTLPYRPGPLSGFVKLNAADAGGRGPDCPAPNRDRTGHVWRRGLPHSLARAGKRGLPHVCCRTATATRSTAFGSRTPCRVVRAEPIRRAKSSLVEYPEDEGADYGTLSIAVAVGHSAADPGADLDLRRPALGQSPQPVADPPAARSNDRPPLWYYVHPRLPRRLFITLHRGTRSPFGTLLATNDLITSRNSALPLRLRPVKHFTGAKWTAAGPFLRRGGQVHGSIPPAAH